MATHSPQRFAELVLAELASLQALAVELHDYIVVDLADRTGKPIPEVARLLAEKRQQRATKYADDLLKRFRLGD